MILRLPTDPMVLTVAGLTVLWLLTAVLAWRSVRKLRRELATVTTGLAEAVQEVEDLTDTIDSLAGIVDGHDALLLQQKPRPVAVPVSVAVKQARDWADSVMGQQPVPDPDPPTRLIPRVVKTPKPVTPEPVRGPITASTLVARYWADSKRQEDE